MDTSRARPSTHGRPVSRQNGVADLQAFAATMIEQHEALLVAATPGELHVNPAFFTPPLLDSSPAPALQGKAQRTTGDLILASSRSPNATPSKSYVASAGKSSGEPDRRAGVVDGVNSTSFATSAFPTLFKTPIDWDREAEELDAQTDVDASVIPRPTIRSEDPSDTVSRRSASSTASATSGCTVRNRTMSGPSQDLPVTPTRTGSKASRKTVATTDSISPDMKNITMRRINFKAATTTSLAATQGSPTPSLTETTRTASLPAGWPAKKAVPTTRTFTRHLVCHWSSRSRPVEEVLKDVVEAQQSQNRWRTRKDWGGTIVRAWEKLGH